MTTPTQVQRSPWLTMTAQQIVDDLTDAEGEILGKELALAGHTFDGTQAVARAFAAQWARAILPDLREVLAVKDAAHYIFGDQECVGEDRDCEEYFTADGKRSGIDVCTHVEHRYATWADRCARERLEDAVRELLGSLKAGSLTMAEVTEEVEGILSGLSYELTMEVPDESGGGKSAWSPAMFREAAEELRVERDHWDKRTEMVRLALDRATRTENVLALVEKRGYSADAAREIIGSSEPASDDYGLAAALANLSDEQRSRVEQAVAHLVADAEAASFGAGLAAAANPSQRTEVTA